MYVLHDMSYSGNAYKVRLALTQLGQPYRCIEYGLHGKSTAEADFRARNPNGRVPVLELADGTCLAESDAILFYLAEGTNLLPESRLDRARVLQWMFFEQYNHEPTIAVVRHWVTHLGKTKENEKQLPGKIEGGYKALQVMETHLKDRKYFVAERYTIADIALYAYTHVAHEGGFDLSPFAAITAWLGRVAGEPRHIKITD
jgi:glutathione S-transferase